MRLFVVTCAIVSLHLFAHSQGSLAERDFKNVPIPFELRMDSVLAKYGPVISMSEKQAFGGKGPIIRGDSIVPGDTIFYEHLRIARCDSVTFAFNDGGFLEYYYFTSTVHTTTRGISVGSTKQDVLRAYGIPNEIDREVIFDDPMQGEDEILTYNYSNSTYGLGFFFSKGKVKRIFVGRGSIC